MRTRGPQAPTGPVHRVLLQHSVARCNCAVTHQRVGGTYPRHQRQALLYLRVVVRARVDDVAVCAFIWAGKQCIEVVVLTQRVHVLSSQHMGNVAHVLVVGRVVGVVFKENAC